MSKEMIGLKAIIVIILIMTISCSTKQEEHVLTLQEDSELLILCYHNIVDDIDDIHNPYAVTKKELKEHIIMLKEKDFISIGLDDLESTILKGSTIPKKAFLITFDDGYQSDYSHVFPLIKEMSVKAAFFPVAGMVNKPGRLTSEQIAEMSESEKCFFGSHSMNHNLNKKLHSEIGDSKRKLEEIIKSPIIFFSYPRGYFDEEIIKVLKHFNYIGAFTVIPTLNKKGTSLFALKRKMFMRQIPFEELIDDKSQTCREALKTYYINISNKEYGFMVQEIGPELIKN